MANRVAVIILNWNGEKLLREFLPSVVKNTNSELGRVVVVDNHSTDGSWACLEQEFPNVERVLFEDNFDFAVIGFSDNEFEGTTIRKDSGK